MGSRCYIERENASKEELRIAKRCASTKQGLAIEELCRGRSPKMVTPLPGAILFLDQRSLPMKWTLLLSALPLGAIAIMWFGKGSHWCVLCGYENWQVRQRFSRSANINKNNLL